MSEWMWFVSIIVGLILGCSCFYKWTEAQVQIEKILNEEKNEDNREYDPTNPGEVCH